MAHEEPRAFDPNDPHGFGDLGEHHGHHITSWKVLTSVLLALLVFTGLTVFASEFETYLTTELGWHLPDWVNVMVAMSIATVKATLVVMIFMALRYENTLYTVVLLFCLFAFALFLALTGMDLDNRGHVYDWKQEARTFGGTGNSIQHGGAVIYDKYEHGRVELYDVDTEGNKTGFTFSDSLTAKLKEKYMAATGISEEEYQRRWADANHVHAHHDDHLSSADRSRPRTGLSGALDEAAHDDHDHGSGH